MRLNQYISGSGFCSRREADRLIEMGKVKVNGKKAVIGLVVDESDRVEVEGKRIQPKKSHVYIALNKPKGIVCTTEKHVKDNIVNFINHKERIFPIGRLDKDSEGLILLTSDGNIVNEILREENAHTKEYQVMVDKTIDEAFIKKMATGVTIYNPVKKKHMTTNPCDVIKVGKTSFTIILSQGLNRQIRRMCQALGYEVLALKRTRIMHIQLGRLKTGTHRNLTPQELKGLFKP